MAIDTRVPSPRRIPPNSVKCILTRAAAMSSNCFSAAPMAKVLLPCSKGADPLIELSDLMGIAAWSRRRTWLSIDVTLGFRPTLGRPGSVIMHVEDTNHPGQPLFKLPGHPHGALFIATHRFKWSHLRPPLHLSGYRTFLFHVHNGSDGKRICTSNLLDVVFPLIATI